MTCWQHIVQMQPAFALHQLHRMPVQRATMRADLRRSRGSRNRLSSFLAAATFSSSASCFCSWGSCISARRPCSGSYSRWAFSMAALVCPDLAHAGSAPCQWRSSVLPLAFMLRGTYPAPAKFLFQILQTASAQHRSLFRPTCSTCSWVMRVCQSISFGIPSISVSTAQAFIHKVDGLSGAGSGR